MLDTGRSDLRFFSRKFLQTCLGVPPIGSCKIQRIFLFSPPLGKSLELLEAYEDLSSWSIRVLLLETVRCR